MEIKRLEILATEIFKTVNNINPPYMNTIFTPKTSAKIRPHDIIARHHNTATYGDKSLIALGPKIREKLPTNINSLTSASKVKGALSGLRQFLATESPLKMMKSAFYVTSKALFVLKIFKFLS